MFKFARTYVPSVRNDINKEMKKFSDDLNNEFTSQRGATAIVELPENGMEKEVILNQVKEISALEKKHFNGKDGNVSGAVYDCDEKHWEFVADIMRETVVSNPMHMYEFKFVTQMEAEMIRWTINLYKGGPNHCGIVTSGGTESIILAVLAYREKGKNERGITKPNIVMSNTAHCAFDKACFYFGVELRKVPITSDCLTDLEAMKQYIDSNTVLLVASAPEYAYGNYDPVPEIAALAKSYDIGCHVDCCLGSYINPFIKELGYE